MLTTICPKLPMRNKVNTIDYYINKLGFEQSGGDYPDYLMVKKDGIEIHFFEYKDLNPEENYGMVYIRTLDIDGFYQSLTKANIPIHPNGQLAKKPWGQKEFSMLDPDNNLLTFGEEI